MKQDCEVVKEQRTGELQRNDDLAAAAVAGNVTDVVTMTTSEDSPQKLQDTCERLLRQLQDVRRNVGRPEDLQVTDEYLLFHVVKFD